VGGTNAVTPGEKIRVDLLDISRLQYAERLTASSLQGLANRGGPRLFLDHGTYDDPGSRTTNSVQMTEEDWHGKYRAYLKTNDRDNLGFYCSVLPLDITLQESLASAIHAHAGCLKGLVVWDPALPDSINLALTLSGVKELLVVHPDYVEQAEGASGVKVAEDLRGRFKDRVSLYRWQLAHLWSACREGQVACMEPEWKRSEFADYIVQNRLFVFSLASFQKGGVRDAGQKLLLALIAGPFWLRNFLFATRLDALVRRLAIVLLGVGSEEVRLAIRIQRAVKAAPYPTIFGWHTQRDDELAFMLLVSANGMRLAPSFMAGNFSFHARLPRTAELAQDYVDPAKVTLERDKVYLTFVLSDGDQLTLNNTAQVGNWRRPEHGMIPFNWETQPLLAEIAPALLGYYYHTLTKNDLLIAGPSGAGYVIPPLVPRLSAYMRESARLCDAADIRVVTSYNGDPPRRVLRALGRTGGNFLGFLAGYFHLGRTPSYMAGERPFVSYAWPHVDQISLESAKVVEGIRALVNAPGVRPRFVACHLFAYRTTITDIDALVKSLDPRTVKVVRADEFLLAARAHLSQKESSRGKRNAH
jgi:hypothetical protein